MTAETLRERALRWIDENPEAMSYFVHFAETMRARGRAFGIGQLAERVRWEVSLHRGDFAINNSYRAYIARWLIDRDQRLADLIRCRRTPAADCAAREARPDLDVNPRHAAREQRRMAVGAGR